MNNYLQNLIAKNFNQTEVARPRLASIFEPLAPNAPTVFGELRDVERLDFERKTEGAGSANMMQENRQDVESKKALSLPTKNRLSDETSVWRGNQQAVTLEQKTNEAQILHHQTTSQNQVEVQPSAPQAIEKNRQENGSLKPRFSNLDESKTQTTQQRNAKTNNENALLSSRALIQREEKNSLQPSLQPHSKILAPPPTQNESTQIRRPINVQLTKHDMKESHLADLPVASETNKIIVQPRIALPLENQKARGKMNAFSQQPLAQAAEIAATPTINVTIGRIEVRATTAIAPPRKQTPAAQTMSLDEYLRQRNRGGGE